MNAALQKIRRCAGGALLVLFVLNGCAALTEGRYIGKDGKDSPYKPSQDRYEPPRDPTARF